MARQVFKLDPAALRHVDEALTPTRADANDLEVFAAKIPNTRGAPRRPPVSVG